MRSPDRGRSGFARVLCLLASVVPLAAQMQNEIALPNIRAIAGQTQAVRWESERKPLSTISSVTTEPALKFPIRAAFRSSNGINQIELTAPPATPARL